MLLAGPPGNTCHVCHVGMEGTPPMPSKQYRAMIGQGPLARGRRRRRQASKLLVDVAVQKVPDEAFIHGLRAWLKEWLGICHDNAWGIWEIRQAWDTMPPSPDVPFWELHAMRRRVSIARGWDFMPTWDTVPPAPAMPSRQLRAMRKQVISARCRRRKRKHAPKECADVGIQTGPMNEKEAEGLRDHLQTWLKACTVIAGLYMHMEDTVMYQYWDEADEQSRLMKTIEALERERGVLALERRQ